MSAADQRHSLRVCQVLLARGCTDSDLLAAALRNSERVPVISGRHGLKKGQCGGWKPLCHLLTFFSRERVNETELLSNLPETINNGMQSYPRNNQRANSHLKSIVTIQAFPILDSSLPTALR